MIFCNGMPKNGTNLLLKICGFLGFKDSEIFIFSDNRGKTKARKPERDSGAKERIHIDAAFEKDNAYFCHAHLFPWNFTNHKVITIFRDPRNAIVSAMRYQKKHGMTERETIIKFIRYGYRQFPTWVDYNNKFLPWLHLGLPVRFEKISEVDTLEEICNYLGVEADCKLLSENLLGGGKVINGKPMYSSFSTWSGKNSDWKEYWDEKIDKLFMETGGGELLEALGYDR